jgi:hypothetical protein
MISLLLLLLCNGTFLNTCSGTVLWCQDPSEQVSWSSNTSDLYSGGARVESRPEPNILIDIILTAPWTQLSNINNVYSYMFRHYFWVIKWYGMTVQMIYVQFYVPPEHDLEMGSKHIVGKNTKNY